MVDDAKSEPDELETIYPGEDVTVRLRGAKLPEVVRIEPFYSSKFMAATAAIKPLAGALARVVTFTGTGIALRFQDGDDPKGFIERVFESAENGGEVVIDIVSLATGKPKKWFDALPIECLADLMEAVWRQNKKHNGDFFVKRLWPKLQGLFQAQAPGGAPSAES